MAPRQNMRIVIFEICILLVLGVAGATLLATVSNHRESIRDPRFRQSLLSELVWTIIPFLILVAAAAPAGIAIVIIRILAEDPRVGGSIPL
jgi:heme/copper-type cytochrome/quinol oxidase subunit 2